MKARLHRRDGKRVVRVRKLTIVLLIACCAALGHPSTARAEGPPEISEEATLGAGYFDPTPGESPHGGYTTSTDKCKVCHAVHGAAVSGQRLLRSEAANACTFCHITGGFAIDQPYGIDETGYTIDYENNHASSHEGSTYAGCQSCHSVHGSDTEDTAAFAPGKILRDDPGGAVAPGGVTSMNEFCVDCHDNRSGAGCGADACHNGGTGGPQDHVYVNTEDGGTSHVMTAADGTRAFIDSSDCRDCHSGGNTGLSPTTGNSFPHLTLGAQFLMDTHDTTTGLDEVCLSCHVNGAGDAGVGKTF